MNSQSATAKEVTVQHRRHKVYFVRHGVAQHNLSHNSKKDARYTDSKLVGRGQKQASHVGKLLYREFVERQPHQHQRLARIYVSPLTRCLQTASFIFQSLWQQESASGAQRQCIVHPIQVTCREELREAYGVYFSDKRILKSQLQVRKKGIFILMTAYFIEILD
jgi:bisphosphoglycerate-dependent phosphoglycerate mutase